MPEPGEPGAGRGRAAPRGRGRVRLGRPSLPRRPRRGRLPAHPGPRDLGRDRRGRARAATACASAIASRCGPCWPAGRATRAASVARTCAPTSRSSAPTSTARCRSACVVPASQVFAVGDMAPAVTAFVEPTSIGVRTVVRARVSAEDRVVVLGAGPIGQAVCLAARDLGAAVLMADVVPERLEHARAMGAEEVVCGDAAAVADQVRDWAGGDGVAVLIETTGVPAVVRSAFDVIAPGGAARPGGALAPRGQPAAHGLPDQGARRPRGELLQRRRVRRRGGPRAPQRGRRSRASSPTSSPSSGRPRRCATSPAARPS